MATEKKQSFFGGAAVLAAGVVIVKIIGALFKIPLANILGETGNADFNNAYNIYAVLLTISTAGLPVALSKMISEAKTLGRERQARRVLKVSFAAFLTLGVLSFVIMWFGNEKCAALLNNPNAAYGIKALAPGVVCVGCLAAFRGFAQGSFRMTPTAVSQIIEAVSKLFIGLGLSMYVVSLGYEDYIAAAAAIVGVTVGSVLALVYMLIDYLRHRPRTPGTDTPDASGAILKRLLSIAIPITLSASMVSIITLIDTSLVQGQLQNALGYTLKETRHLYGTYSSGMNLYNLPSSMMTALTISVIPTVSASLARNDRVHTSRVINSSLRVTGLMAFPMGLGLWALAEPIMKLCYPRYDSELGGSLLAVLGIASMFVCLMLISNSILQSYGRVHVPVFTMLIGGVVKIIVNYVLVGNPDILINGAGGNNPRATTDKEYYFEGDLDAEVKSFFDLDADGVSFVFNLNFLGTLLPTQAFARQMLGRPGCNILNISSMNAFTPLTKIPAYSGAKAAISNFTQWLAVHFSKAGIRVNAIAPGFFVTKQNEKLLFDDDGNPTPRTGKILAATPMGRFGKAEELSGAVLFLLNNEAASFITGVVLPIDGGFSAYSGV